MLVVHNRRDACAQPTRFENLEGVSTDYADYFVNLRNLWIAAK